MFSTLKNLTFAAVIGLSSLAAVPAAHADGVYFSIGQGGATVTISDHDRRHRGPGWDRHDRRGPACTARQAVSKANRMGLRRANVIREDRRTVHVAGRSRYGREIVVFARAPHCPVIRSL
jgi:hypothetical protein